MLHVVIPTFDRKRELLLTLQALLANDVERSLVEITVLDNASPTLSERDVLGVNNNGYRVEYIRHRVNLGAPGNVLRSFEVCRRDWLWILGDDDPPCSTALGIILSAIQVHPNAIFQNFGEPGRTATESASGFENVMGIVKHFGHVVWLSAGIYHIQQCLPFLKYGHGFSYTQMSHTVVLLKAIDELDDAMVVMHPQTVVEQQAIADESSHWCHVNSAVAGGTWADLPLRHRNLLSLGPHLVANVLQRRFMFLTFLVKEKDSHFNGSYARLFWQYVHRSCSISVPSSLRLECLVLASILTLAPRPAWWLVCAAGRLRFGEKQLQQKIDLKRHNDRNSRV